MVVARGQTFKAEPLSKRTNGTRRPEQSTKIYSGRVWSKPSGGKSSSENTMQVAMPTITIWIKPSGVVVVSTLIWLKGQINVSLWVLEDAIKLEIEIRAWVLYNFLIISSFSLLTSSWEDIPSKGLEATEGCCRTTLTPRITYYTFEVWKSSTYGVWTSSTSGIKTNVVWTLQCGKVNGSTVVVCTDATSETSLKGVDIWGPKVTLPIS